MSLTAIDLFCGAGGLSKGLEDAGIDVSLAVDTDPDALNTYRRNHSSDCTILECDLSNTSPSTLLDEVDLSTAEVDLVVGGPPCQGFSSAGTGIIDDPRNALLKRFVEFVDEIQPTAFLLENVEGLLTAGDGKFVREVHEELHQTYSVTHEKLYATTYGVPQRRKRVFFAGVRNGFSEYSFPSPTHSESNDMAQATLTSGVLPPKLSIEDAISDLPAPIQYPGAEADPAVVEYDQPPKTEYQSQMRNATEGVTNHYKRSDNNISKIVKERILALGEGETMQDLPEDLWHDSYSDRRYRRVEDGMPTEKRGGPPAGIRRLVRDEPSLTITGAVGNEMVHYEEDRFLTPREAARIQSFPDTYVFLGSKTSVYKQIANAVPPLMGEKIASEFLNVEELASNEAV
jgi:DNA (cytosine-5)-methyltransferase 1